MLPFGLGQCIDRLLDLGNLATEDMWWGWECWTMRERGVSLGPFIDFTEGGFHPDHRVVDLLQGGLESNDTCLEILDCASVANLSSQLRKKGLMEEIKKIEKTHLELIQ